LPEILPFHAIFYKPSRVALTKVLSPPYDVISAIKQDELYARDPLNVIRLEYAKEADPYAHAGRILREWLNTEILVRENEPSIYLLCQRFIGRDGGVVRRNGFIALCRLEELGSKTILPHEKTFPKPKEDRLKLLSQTNAMFSPIFSIYVDESKLIERLYLNVSSESSLLSGELEGVSHDIWRLTDARTMVKIQEVLRGSQVFIADGHHRYETALEYRRTQRSENPRHAGSEGYNYTLMYFSNVEEEGLVIFPIHRVIRGLKKFDGQEFLKEIARGFDVQPFDTSEGLVQELRGWGQHSFGIAISGEQKFYLASLRNVRGVDELIPQHTPGELKQLDVVLLHAYILSHVLRVDDQSGTYHPRIEFLTDESEALTLVQRGEAQVAFLLNPTPVEQVQAVARAGLTMPQKSTYFYPKLPAGLAMYDLGEF
jgi:uncharacterized protein (DUF1015 family)